MITKKEMNEKLKEFKKKLENELEQAIVELYKSGKTQKEVAKELKIGDRTVRNVLKKYGIEAQVSEKQLDYLFSLIEQIFEVDDLVKTRQELNRLSLKQVRGMIMTLKDYQNIRNKIKYYEKMFNFKVKR